MDDGEGPVAVMDAEPWVASEGVSSSEGSKPARTSAASVVSPSSCQADVRATGVMEPVDHRTTCAAYP